jgi:FtsP/CotA-like multicopper oxidase with cupredoxin domain
LTRDSKHHCRYGTTWYHSHYSSQYTGGLWGPLIIHGPSSAPYDVDLGPVTLTDYYHRGYFDILADVMGTDLKKVRPAADTNLINGKMNFDCSNSTTGAKCTNNAGVSKFQFTSGKKHKLRLINTGTAGIQKFSIDNHKLSVIANDMIQIQPYTTEIVTLAVSRTFHQRAL